MHRLLGVLLASVVGYFFIPSAHAQSTDPQTCNLDGNQQEMNGCAIARFKKSDEEMNRLYAAQAARLSQASRRPLRESQKAWVVYRDKACYYESGTKGEAESHATTAPLVHYRCLESLTKQRSQVLNQYLECTQNGCPE
jgi:uncharacterized protein YecT (DUF1311 family)